MKTRLIAALLCVAATLPAHATLLTLDGASGPVPGGADCTFACVISYQQAYDNALFGSSLITISGIDFLSTSSRAWGAGNQYQIKIGIANGGVNALGANFAGNFQSSQVFETKSFSGTTSNGSWFGFDGSYDYNPLLGDLLINITRIGGSAGGPGVQYTSTSGGEFSRVFDWSSTTSGYIGNDYGNTTRFEYAPTIQVPEPASLGLLGAGLAALTLSARRKR